eukprot:6680181-Alexandrium_andersonii.AAC.1
MEAKAMMQPHGNPALARTVYMSCLSQASKHLYTSVADKRNAPSFLCLARSTLAEPPYQASWADLPGTPAK